MHCLSHPPLRQVPLVTRWQTVVQVSPALEATLSYFTCGIISLLWLKLSFLCWKCLWERKNSWPNGVLAEHNWLATWGEVGGECWISPGDWFAMSRWMHSYVATWKGLGTGAEKIDYWLEAVVAVWLISYYMVYTDVPAEELLPWNLSITTALSNSVHSG